MNHRMLLTIGAAAILLAGCENRDAGKIAMKMVGETCKGKVSTEARVTFTGTEFVIRCDDANWKDGDVKK